jgi:uncharacterized protein YaaR (DUF327 family)
MMRVDSAGGQRPEMPESNRLKKKKKGEAAGGASQSGGDSPAAPVGFKQAFMDQAKLQTTQSLDEMMKELSMQGDRLQRSQTFAELEIYKNLVRAFLHKISHELYHLQEAGPAPVHHGQKVNVIIQKVDERLDALAKQVLGRQARQLNILDRLDEIRGLLMDLYK